ncbi:hypothetical protein CRG98_037079 [Punica granatum]|uniref:Uncharacterized protein n=1 Tax=Punica granatum TaxID=22663 RepID=A0A2I0IFL0_PUNGR|nr:hypothetical protein CRG98_037079 [Punica granatum]
MISTVESGKSKGKEGSRPLIGDPDPSTKVAGTHRGYWRPRWRSGGGRLAAQPRIDWGFQVEGPRSVLDWGRQSLISVEGSGSSIGGPNSNRSRTSDLVSPVDSGLEPPIGDPDPSTKVAGVLRGHRRPLLPFRFSL